jgi:hypothetical protein
MVQLFPTPFYTEDEEKTEERLELTTHTTKWRDSEGWHETKYEIWQEISGKKKKEEEKSTTRKRHPAESEDLPPAGPGRLLTMNFPHRCKIAAAGKGKRRGELFNSEKRPVCICEVLWRILTKDEPERRRRVLQREMDRFFETNPPPYPEKKVPYTIEGTLPWFRLPTSAIGIGDSNESL